MILNIESILPHDLDEVHQVSRELQAGSVHVNIYGDDNAVLLRIGEEKKDSSV